MTTQAHPAPSPSSSNGGARPAGAGLADGGPADTGSEHIALVETYFDANAREWSDLYRRAQRVNDLVLAARRDRAVELLSRSLPAGARVMDAGCGAGLTALALVQRGFHVHGIDVSQRMLDCCAENFAEHGIPPERYELSRTDVVRGGFEPETFDGIAALGFLQYQRDELEALRQLWRVLRPGGVLVVTGPTQRRLSELFGAARYYYVARASVARLVRRARGPAAPRPAPPASAQASGSASTNGTAAPSAQHHLLERISVHAYSPARFRALLEQAGFRYERHVGHGFVNFAIVGRRLGYRGELLLHRSLSAAARVLPIGRWANDLIVVARKP